MDLFTDAPLLGVVVFAIWKLSAVLGGLQEAIREGNAERLDGAEARLEDLVADMVKLSEVVDLLPNKWEEMVKKARRSEERTREIARRAVEELEEGGIASSALVESTADLFLTDGQGSPSNGVQPMRAGVGGVPQTGSPEPSWEEATLAFKYGRR